MSDVVYDTDETDPYDELSARLDALEIASEVLYSNEPDDDPWTQASYPQQVAVESLQDGQTAREHLTAIAEQTRNAVMERSGLDPNFSMAANADPVQQAMEIVAKAIPTWSEDAPKVKEYLEQSGADLGPVIATDDPTVIAKALFSAHMGSRQAEENRRMKQSAQTMIGSNGGRDAPRTAWDDIKEAGSRWG